MSTEWGLNRVATKSVLRNEKLHATSGGQGSEICWSAKHEQHIHESDQFPLPAHGAQPKHECVLAVLRHVDGVGIEPSRDEVSFEERKTARDEWRSRE
jgi:hypothetical protein